MNQLLSHSSPTMRGLRIIMLLCILSCGITSSAQQLIYVGSTPANGETITSLDDIRLNFDFTNVIAVYGENENWGICYSGYVGDDEEPEKSVRVYKGDPESGELLVIGYTDILKPNNANFESGNYLRLSFPDIQIESGQKYTLVITDKFSAGIKGEKKKKSDTEIDCTDSPIELVFYGASETKKILRSESNSVNENSIYEQMPEVKVFFNYDVTVNNDSNVIVYDGNEEICVSNSVTVDSENSNAIIVKFPETPLYLGHSYDIVIPEGCISIAGDNEIVNQEVSITIKGASYRYFGAGRVRPSNGSVSVLDEITVPFKFPEAEGKNYGFVNVDNGFKKWYIHVYEGNTADGEEMMAIAGEVGDDMKSLIFRPNYVFEPETEYTFVIPEGDVLAYEIGAPGESYLKDYLSERVELHYTTPSVASLPAWTPAPVNIKDGDTVEELAYFILDCPDYEYEGMVYSTVFNNRVYGDDAALYMVTEDGDKEVCTFRIYRNTFDVDSEIGNGEYIGRYFYGAVNQPLYKGKQYKIVWAANSVIVDNPFIGKYIGNPEITVMLNGAYETEFAVNCHYGEAMTMSTVVNRGQDATLTFAPGEDWAIDTVTVDDEAAAVEDNTLVITGVDHATDVYVTYRYDGICSFDFTTGVEASVAECPYEVTVEPCKVIIDGLAAGATVDVYNTVGMQMATATATDSRMTLTVNAGIVVIVIREPGQLPVGLTLRIPA